MAETGIRKWVITATIVAGVLLEIIDSTVVNVALTNIMGSLGATVADVGWVVTIYMLANVIILPISGWIGNRFGKKQYFLTSIIVFTVASFLCGNASNLVELVVFRLLQGLAGGGLLSTGQAMLMDTWPKKEWGMATAIFGMGVMIGPAIGPTLGGYIVDHMSWQWIFFINIPVGIVAAFLVSTFMRQSPKEGKGQPVDWWGILLLTITIGSLQTVLERGQAEAWFQATYIIVLSATAIVGGICFVWRELVIDHPILDFSIFRHGTFTIGNIIMLLFGLILYCSMFAFPLFCQNMLRLTAQQTGMLLVPSTIVSVFVMPLVGAMHKKGVPGHLLAMTGVVFMAICMFMMSGATLETGASYFFWPMILLGIGRSFLFVPFGVLALQDLTGKEIGQGTGLNNLARQLGGTLGVALFATVLQIQTSTYRNILIENVNQYNPLFQDRYQGYVQGFLGKGLGLEQAQNLALKTIETIVMNQAQLLTYNNIYRLATIMVLCIVPLFLLQRTKKKAVVTEGVK